MAQRKEEDRKKETDKNQGISSNGPYDDISLADCQCQQI